MHESSSFEVSSFLTKTQNKTFCENTVKTKIKNMGLQDQEIRVGVPEPHFLPRTIPRSSYEFLN